MEHIIAPQQKRLYTIPENARCDYCNAQEGKKRLIGQFIVRLRTVEVFGTQKLACQTCFRKEEEIKASRLSDKQNKPARKKHVSWRIKRVRYRHLISLNGLSSGLLMLLSANALAWHLALPAQPGVCPWSTYRTYRLIGIQHYISKPQVIERVYESTFSFWTPAGRVCVGRAVNSQIIYFSK